MPSKSGFWAMVAALLGAVVSTYAVPVRARR
jgi:hypothetical protein